MIYALLLASGDGSGLPTTWPGAFVGVALLILIGFMTWCFTKD